MDFIWKMSKANSTHRLNASMLRMNYLLQNNEHITYIFTRKLFITLNGTSFRPITTVKQRQTCIVTGWVTIEHSDVRLAFRRNPRWIMLTWIADLKAQQTVQPRCDRQVVLESNLKNWFFFLLQHKVMASTVALEMYGFSEEEIIQTSRYIKKCNKLWKTL